MATRVDFIVVGAGTAGSGMAGRLAQAGRTCLVVEAGGSDARSAGEIADASVMPVIPRGHPNAVVAAIADRGARLILAAAGA